MKKTKLGSQIKKTIITTESSFLEALDPSIHVDDLLSTVGYISEAKLEYDEKNPLIL